MNTITKLNHLLNQKKSHCDNACESQGSVLKNCFICHKSGHYAYECPEKRNRKKYRFLFKRDENLFKKKVLKLIKNLNNFLVKRKAKKEKEINLNYDVNSNKKDKNYFRNLIKLEKESAKEIEKDLEERRNQRRKEFKRREEDREERRAQNVKPQICRDYIREKINNFKIFDGKLKSYNIEKFLRIKVLNIKYFNEELEKLFKDKFNFLFKNNEANIKESSVIENPINSKVPLVDSKETAVINRGLVVDESLIVKEETTREKALQIEIDKEKNKQENKEENKEVEKEEKKEEKSDKMKEILDKFSNLNKNEISKDSDNLTVISSVSSLISSTSNSSISEKEIEEYKKKSYSEKRKKILELWNKEQLDKKDMIKIYNLISSLIKYKKFFENEVESFKKACKDNLSEIARELKG